MNFKYGILIAIILINGGYMIKLKKGDTLVTTTHGELTVQVNILFNENTNPDYDQLGGRSLYWFADEFGNDFLYWDRELKDLVGA